MVNPFGDTEVIETATNPFGDSPAVEPTGKPDLLGIILANYREGKTTPKQSEAIAELIRRGEIDIASQMRTEQAQETGPLKALAVGTGKGFMNVARGVGFADDPAPEDIAGYEALKEERPYTTGAGEILGEAAPFIPTGVGIGNIAKTGVRAAATGLMGAAEGGIIAEGTGGDAITGAGIGGTIGVGAEMLFPVIGRMGRRIYQKAMGKAPTGAMLDAAGKPTAELSEALQKAGISFEDLTQDSVDLISTSTKNLEPSQVVRKEFLESQGITPTKAQVTRDAADFQAQQEAAKTSGRVRNALEGQEHALTTRFDDAVISTGGQSGAPSVSVIDSVVDKATTLDREISDLYKMARAVAPGTENVQFDRLTKLLRKYTPANRRTGGNISAIIGELKDSGLLDKGAKISGKASVETAENIRKTMNSLYDPQNPYGNMILRELKDALDDDVFKASGDDVFKQARKAKADFEGELSRAKISKFDSRKQNLVRDILENKIDPDRFADKVVFGKSWRAGDIDQLKKYVGDGPEWNNLKADVLSTIRDRSFIGPEDANGLRALSRDRLERTLNQIGTKKLKTIFAADEVKFLDDILKVAKMREPVRGTALGRGPSAQAVASIEAKLKNTPFLGFLVDVVNVDAAGRAALKANPAKIATESMKRTAIPGATTAAAGATAISTAKVTEGENK